MEKKDLSEVIKRCQMGERQAQETLVMETQNHIYFHCWKMMKQEDDALDATQEILISMLEGIKNLREPAAFWGWLNQITANRCKNLMTRGPRESQIPEDEEGNSLLDTYESLDEQTVPDKALDNEETRRMVMDLVDALPEAQRLCVLMYYYDEMSVKDIAAALEVSEGTIKSRLNYARKSIKDGVDRYTSQGIKLYSFSPLPFLLFFLQKDANACCLTAEQSAALAQEALLAANGVGIGVSTAASEGVADTNATISGAAAVNAAAAGTAAKVGSGVGTKMIAGALAATIVVGGAVTGTKLLHQPSEAETSSTIETVQQPERTEVSEGSLLKAVTSRAEQLTASASRYTTLGDFLTGLPDASGEYLLYDCDEDGDIELLAVTTGALGELAGCVYDLGPNGEVYATCVSPEGLVDAGAGTLTLGCILPEIYDDQRYFTICYSNGEDGALGWEDTYQYILYTAESGTLTKAHDIRGTVVTNYAATSKTYENCTMDGVPIDEDAFLRMTEHFARYIDNNGEYISVTGSNGFREVYDGNGWRHLEPTGDSRSSRERCIEICKQMSEKMTQPRPIPRNDAAARYAAFYERLDEIGNQVIMQQQSIQEEQSWFAFWDYDNDGEDELAYFLKMTIPMNSLQVNIIDLYKDEVILAYYDSAFDDSNFEVGILEYEGQRYIASKTSTQSSNEISINLHLETIGGTKGCHNLSSNGRVDKDGVVLWDFCILDEQEMDGEHFSQILAGYQMIFNAQGESSFITPVHRNKCMKQCVEQVESLNSGRKVSN
ncbi:MAG: sigma-70 family RNA polymerase sigma factor [Dysosmobacter sp.]|nr:sigma-70 family RNA polymerase sigma factor [Dysosmobacter sp.]